MKALALIALTLFSNQVYATVRNSEGFVTADPVYESDDAYVMITGEAATQLYNHLKIAIDPQGFGDVKTGKNITCGVEPVYGGVPEKITYLCKMYIKSDGSILTE